MSETPAAGTLHTAIRMRSSRVVALLFLAALAARGAARYCFQRDLLALLNLGQAYQRGSSVAVDDAVGSVQTGETRHGGCALRKLSRARLQSGEPTQVSSRSQKVRCACFTRTQFFVARSVRNSS
jgi:hypothetical protein